MAWQSDNAQQVLVAAPVVFKETGDSDSAGHEDSGIGGDTPTKMNAHTPMRKVAASTNERSPVAAPPVVVAGKESHEHKVVPTAVVPALENGRAAMTPVLERTPPHPRDEASRAMPRPFMVASEEMEEYTFGRNVMGPDVEKAAGVTCEAKTPSREEPWSPSCSEETASHTTDASPFRQDISPGPSDSPFVGRGTLFPVEQTSPLDAASTFLPPTLIDEGEEVEEASFLPPSLRSGKQSAMDKWSKRDLFLHEDGEIARGSFAKVITVTKGIEGIVLAVKAIPQNLPDRGPQEEYIAREVELLKICGVHPNVIGFLGCVKTSEIAFVIMPLASTDVKKLVKERGPLGEEEAVVMIQQFVSALEFVHGKRIIHRDLKPANLLLTPELKVLLADFGVAKMLPDGEDSMTGVCGTEVSRVEYSTQADMWAAGVVTYEMLHGVTPFCPKERAAAGTDQSRDSMAALHEKSNILSGEYDVDPRRLLTLSPLSRMPARIAAEHDWLGGATEAAVRRAATAAAVAQQEAAQAADRASRQRLQKRARRPRRTSPRQV